MPLTIFSRALLFAFSKVLHTVMFICLIFAMRKKQLEEGNVQKIISANLRAIFMQRLTHPADANKLNLSSSWAWLNTDPLIHTDTNQVCLRRNTKHDTATTIGFLWWYPKEPLLVPNDPFGAVTKKWRLWRCFSQTRVFSLEANFRTTLPFSHSISHEKHNLPFFT